MGIDAGATRECHFEAIHILEALATSDSYTRHVLQRVRSNDFVQAKRLWSHMQLHLFQPKDSFIHNQLLHFVHQMRQTLPCTTPV
ncbi:hypothetical protein PIB30_019148 [Stylosanthes scabra]|uniref:Uncharacterized protein n=1 Tax=Stylosanthes scabra TaxID=79078 RepID=A0ABU6X9N0_9FABA|nr:hypothetical protein [Stylosanthes scabra]